MKNGRFRADLFHRLAVLRLVTAAIKQKEVDERIELDDAQVLAVLDKMVKQRRESLEQYRAARRDDLADQEAFELELIQTYLPEPLGDAELAGLISDGRVDVRLPLCGPLDRLDQQPRGLRAARGYEPAQGAHPHVHRPAGLVERLEEGGGDEDGDGSARAGSGGMGGSEAGSGAIGEAGSQDMIEKW